MAMSATEHRRRQDREPPLPDLPREQRREHEPRHPESRRAEEAYIAAQLRAFKSGERKNDFMSAIASQLGEEDIANLAAYWNSLPTTAEAGLGPFEQQVADDVSRSIPEGVRAVSLELGAGRQHHAILRE